VVLSDTSAGGCDSDACLAAMQTSGSTPETIVLATTQGQRVYLVVEAATAAQVDSSFSLGVSCVKQ
jgi:hypothetical protein